MRRLLWLSVTLGCVLPHGSGRPSNGGWTSNTNNNPSTYRSSSGPNAPLPPFAPGYDPSRPYGPGYGDEGAYGGPAAGGRRGDVGGSKLPPGGRRMGGSTIGSSLPRRRRRGESSPFQRGGGRYGVEDEDLLQGEEDDGMIEEEEVEIDAVDLYCSRTMGRLAVTLAAGVVGSLIGAAISASTFHRPTSFATGGLVLGVVLSIFRNDFGALLRALGLMLILLLQRNREAGGQYSALRQLGPALRFGARRPFPPSENPWAYVRSSEADIEFSMAKSLLAITFVGCFTGWLIGQMVNLFILPPWLLALGIGGFSSYISTLRDGRGDLLRVLGMKLVAMVGLLRALDEELAVLGKLAKVCHISVSTAARIDAQFKIREKVWGLVSLVMSLVNREANRVKHDMDGSGGSPYPPGSGDHMPPASAPYASTYGRQRGAREEEQEEEHDPWARLPPYNPDAAPAAGRSSYGGYSGGGR